MLALVVSLAVRADAREDFLSAIAEQARTSLAEEPGCLRFDIAVDVDDPNHFVLYEIYADEDAFAVHRTTPHFERWSAAKARLVERQESTKAELL